MWRLAQGGSMMVIIMQINLLQVRLLHRPSSAAARSCFIVSRIKRAILAADTGRNWDWLSWQRLVGSNESFTRSRNTILFKKITIYNWAAVILNFNGESNMEASGTLRLSEASHWIFQLFSVSTFSKHVPPWHWYHNSNLHSHPTARLWAMCRRAGCLILSLNIWRGESRGPLPEPSQLFAKYSNTLARRRTFQISPTSKWATTPYFSH